MPPAEAARAARTRLAGAAERRRHLISQLRMRGLAALLVDARDLELVLLARPLHHRV